MEHATIVRPAIDITGLGCSFGYAKRRSASSHINLQNPDRPFTYELHTTSRQSSDLYSPTCILILRFHLPSPLNPLRPDSNPPVCSTTPTCGNGRPPCLRRAAREEAREEPSGPALSTECRAAIAARQALAADIFQSPHGAPAELRGEPAGRAAVAARSQEAVAVAAGAAGPAEQPADQERRPGVRGQRMADHPHRRDRSS